MARDGHRPPAPSRKRNGTRSRGANVGRPRFGRSNGRARLSSDLDSAVRSRFRPIPVAVQHDPSRRYRARESGLGAALWLLRQFRWRTPGLATSLPGAPSAPTAAPVRPKPRSQVSRSGRQRRPLTIAATLIVGNSWATAAVASRRAEPCRRSGRSAFAGTFGTRRNPARPWRLHGKEGVIGSSPIEGFNKYLLTGSF
jgi:hypothetical protein